MGVMHADDRFQSSFSEYVRRECGSGSHSPFMMAISDLLMWCFSVKTDYGNGYV